MAQVTASQHLKNLRNLCRICGRNSLSRAQQIAGLSSLPCYKYVEAIKHTFAIDVSADNSEQHPPNFCLSCRKKLSNKNVNYIGTAQEVWPFHSETCTVCSHSNRLKRGGRPKKMNYGGRPKSTCRSAMTDMEVGEYQVHFNSEMQEVGLEAPPAPTAYGVLPVPVFASVQSPPPCGVPVMPGSACASVQSPPPCGVPVMPGSACASVQSPPPCGVPVMPGSACASLQSPPPCGVPVMPESGCAASPAPIPEPMHIQQVIEQVKQPGPLRPWEDKLLAPLIKRKLTSSSHGLIKCKTGGQPITLVKITSARKPSSEASSSTVRRRTSELQQARAAASGGEEQAQLVMELRAITRQDLARTLQELSLDTIRLPTGHLLAAAVDLGLTWSQTRNLKRWMKQYHIVSESERSSRKVAAALLEKQEVVADLIPLVVKGEGQGKVVELRPCAKVANLEVSILDNIDRTAQAGHLDWYNQQIPEDEVWIKVLGDHGGDLFKMGFQVMNQPHPNASTAVFCAFQAKDSRENLMSATKDLCTEVGEMAGTIWTSPDGSEKHLRIFVSGDYMILSLWFGLSGPCGSYPCLYCQVHKQDMKKAEPEQVPARRTLASLAANHRSFQEDGCGDIRRAKSYMNVIAPQMLAIETDQVCIPALHISLGIFHKLFRMLENDLRDLDVIMGTHISKVTLADPDVDRAEVLLHPDLYTLAGYVESVEEARQFDVEVEELEEEMEEIEDLLAWAMFQGQEHCLNVLSLQLRFQKMEKRKEDLISKAAEVRERGGLKLSNGPLGSLLDPVLQEYRVKRQAYHTQAFIGSSHQTPDVYHH
ncbi:PREDICTED: uncharacterized protein LOC109482826 [Branchiostoma belcheri]|uniref:Uncharacterized protein LOC109482826 n=1 Tax=Branchiostoma belcheri TaxID=7741 RepID=A0A6P4ZJ39_BRABE|nr:PREDICTED: uncharacterized protein LOC109482826 [Branchiostoma belcheri]